MDYFTILNLNKEPFSNSPDPDYFFHSHQHVSCLQKLELSLRLKRGLNVVIGDVGTGKTTLCRQLIRKLSDDDTIETHLVLDPSFSNTLEFLFTVAEMLAPSLPDKQEDEYQLKEHIKNALYNKGVDEKKTTVLIIDEGQKIPEFCLELLREFLNYETNDYKLLQIAIFAQKEFAVTLEKYANFADRINLYHRLEPMNFKDTRSMIQFRLNRSSGATQKLALFTYPALWAIYRATRGYPRKIVNLCHRSMLAMIIQNKTRANWFLVQSCMKRAFQASGKRSWILASLVAALAAAAIVLTPRLTPDRTPSEVSLQPDAYQVHTSRDIAVDTGTEPGQTIENNLIEVGRAQAAKQEIEPALSLKKPAPQESGSASGKVASISSTNLEPDAADTLSGNLPQTPNPEVVPGQQPPKVLGRLEVRNYETLGGLIQKVYGIFNPQYLHAVLEMNPQVTDPNAIDVGDVVVFPAIPLSIEPHGQNLWWIEMDRRDNMKAAFTLLRTDPELTDAARMIPFWNPSSGLHFSIIANKYYYDAATAEEMLNTLSPEGKPGGRLISTWGDETVFYANPFLGL